MKKIILKYLFSCIVFVFFTSCTSQDSLDDYEKEKGLFFSWNEKAIAYSGYRNGQHPDKFIFPSKEQILEDLKIIEQNWGLIRTYGADQHIKDILDVIARNKLNIKVMLGIWLFKEPERIEDNREQIDSGIELANKYKNIVIAVNVGNETQVKWSDHKVPKSKMVSYLNEVKSKVSVPVTTADSWDYWIELEQSSDVIEAVDFVAVHIYPIWGKIDIDRAMEVTVETYSNLRKAIPDKIIVITEAGWATYTEGDLHVPKAGDEVKQKKYYQDLMKWSKENNILVFWFEAFDEPWKGSGTEGHWGLFSEQRKAKLVMHELYPKLVTDEPTSPSYN